MEPPTPLTRAVASARLLAAIAATEGRHAMASELLDLVEAAHTEDELGEGAAADIARDLRDAVERRRAARFC